LCNYEAEIRGGQYQIRVKIWTLCGGFVTIFHTGLVDRTGGRFMSAVPPGGCIFSGTAFRVRSTG